MKHLRSATNQVWAGEAHDNHGLFQYELQAGLTEAATTFERLEEEYIKVAEGAWNTHKMVAGSVESLIDLGVALAAAAGATAATAWTGAGLVIGGALSAVLVGSIVAVIESIAAAIGTFQLVVDSGKAAFNEFGFVDGAVGELPKLPKPYNNVG